jgi:hypothetical protein
VQLASAQSITRPKAWTADRSIYLRIVRYLPTTCFTREELSTIQRSPIQVLLYTMGFNRNMPLQTFFGLAYLGASVRRTGLSRDLSITRTHPVRLSIRPSDLDTNPVGTSHSRSWLLIT